MKNRNKEFGVRAEVKAYLHSARIRKTEVNEDVLRIIQLANSIRAEIEPQLEKEREAFDRLFGKRHEKQDFVFDLEKYRTGGYRMATGKVEKDFDSDSIEASYMGGMTRAESEQRQAADLAGLKN